MAARRRLARPKPRTATASGSGRPSVPSRLQTIFGTEDFADATRERHPRRRWAWPTATGGSKLSYTLSALPEGLSFDASARTVSGTPMVEGRGLSRACDCHEMRGEGRGQPLLRERRSRPGRAVVNHPPQARARSKMPMMPRLLGDPGRHARGRHERRACWGSWQSRDCRTQVPAGVRRRCRDCSRMALRRLSRWRLRWMAPRRPTLRSPTDSPRQAM